MINVLVWCEHEQDRLQDDVKAAYPEYMHNAIANFLKEDPNLNVRTATLQDDPETCGITDEVLADTDVILWWGHIKHNAVPDAVAEKASHMIIDEKSFWRPCMLYTNSGIYSPVFNSFLFLLRSSSADVHKRGKFQELSFPSPNVRSCGIPT